MTAYNFSIEPEHKKEAMKDCVLIDDVMCFANQPGDINTLKEVATDVHISQSVCAAAAFNSLN